MVSNIDFAGTHGFRNSVSFEGPEYQQPDSQESTSSDIGVAARPDLDMPPNLASVQIHGNLHIQHEGNLDDVPAIRKCVRGVPILD